MLDRSLLKADARRAMKGRNPSVYLVTLAMIGIQYVLSWLSTKLQLGGMNVEDYIEAVLSGYAPVMSPIASIVDFAMSLMLAVLTAGYAYYALRVSRGQEAGFGELFDGFGIFFKIIGLNIVMGVFIALWGLLLIVPGIVAAYRYSMALFILMDDPDTPIMECIRRSKEITRGHKGQLFVLELSFIGWTLLCIIPFVSIFVNPYYQITRANYYNVLSGWQPDPQDYQEPQQSDYNYDYREPWDKQ